MSQTHWKKLTNPNYLGAYSIEDGKDLVLTIKSVKQETVIGTDGKRDECIVCYFQEDVKPMILNSTNCKVIEKLAGTPYIELWKNTRIQIGVERVKAFGDVVDALRVKKKIIKSSADKKVEAIACEQCGNPIKAIGQFPAEQIASINQKRYGKKLCGECSKKLAEAKAAEEAEPETEEEDDTVMSVSAEELEETGGIEE